MSYTPVADSNAGYYLMVKVAGMYTVDGRTATRKEGMATTSNMVVAGDPDCLSGTTPTQITGTLQTRQRHTW